MLQMIAHHALGPVRVTGSYRRIDLLMRSQCQILLTRCDQGNTPLLGQPCEHDLVNGLEYWVAGDAGNGVMERDIRPLKAG